MSATVTDIATPTATQTAALLWVANREGKRPSTTALQLLVHRGWSTSTTKDAELTPAGRAALGSVQDPQADTLAVDAAEQTAPAATVQEVRAELLPTVDVDDAELADAMEAAGIEVPDEPTPHVDTDPATVLDGDVPDAPDTRTNEQVEADAAQAEHDQVEHDNEADAALRAEEAAAAPAKLRWTRLGDYAFRSSAGHVLSRLELDDPTLEGKLRWVLVDASGTELGRWGSHVPAKASLTA